LAVFLVMSANWRSFRGFAAKERMDHVRLHARKAQQTPQFRRVHVESCLSPDREDRLSTRPVRRAIRRSSVDGRMKRLATTLSPAKNPTMNACSCSLAESILNRSAPALSARRPISGDQKASTPVRTRDPSGTVNEKSRTAQAIEAGVHVHRNERLRHPYLVSDTALHFANHSWQPILNQWQSHL